MFFPTMNEPNITGKRIYKMAYIASFDNLRCGSYSFFILADVLLAKYKRDYDEEI